MYVPMTRNCKTIFQARKLQMLCLFIRLWTKWKRKQVLERSDLPRNLFPKILFFSATWILNSLIKLLWFIAYPRSPSLLTTNIPAVSLCCKTGKIWKETEKRRHGLVYLHLPPHQRLHKRAARLRRPVEGGQSEQDHREQERFFPLTPLTSRNSLQFSQRHHSGTVSKAIKFCNTSGEVFGGWREQTAHVAVWPPGGDTELLIYPHHDSSTCFVHTQAMMSL